MSFHVLGRVVVILGSTKATKSLLERRGHTYSDRPVIPFFEMCAFGSGDLVLLLIRSRMDILRALPFAKYGSDFRRARKIAERCYRPASLAQYSAIQERKTRVLVTRMLETPQEWAAHIEL